MVSGSCGCKEYFEEDRSETDSIKPMKLVVFPPPMMPPMGHDIMHIPLPPPIAPLPNPEPAVGYPMPVFQQPAPIQMPQPAMLGGGMPAPPMPGGMPGMHYPPQPPMGGGMPGLPFPQPAYPHAGAGMMPVPMPVPQVMPGMMPGLAQGGRPGLPVFGGLGGQPNPIGPPGGGVAGGAPYPMPPMGVAVQNLGI